MGCSATLPRQLVAASIAACCLGTVGTNLTGGFYHFFVTLYKGGENIQSRHQKSQVKSGGPILYVHYLNGDKQGRGNVPELKAIFFKRWLPFPACHRRQ